MAVSKRLRFEILRRDNHTCRYCGATPPVKMTVDHVTPLSLGGSDDPSNLVASCADCNSGKSATPPTAAVVDDVKQSHLRWAAAMERAAQIAGEEAAADRAAKEDLYELIECQWTHTWLEDPAANDTATRFRHPGRYYAPRPHDWTGSLDRMIAGGLTPRDLQEALTIAQRNSRIDWDETWRYFCGVAWKMLRDRQEIALSLLESGEV